MGRLRQSYPPLRMPTLSKGTRRGRRAQISGCGRIVLFSKPDKPSEQARQRADGLPPALPDYTEEQLVEAARTLDDEVWAEIYRRHAPQVYGYIYFRLRDQHAAEDLAADVFVKAIAGIGGYVWRGTPLLAWLYRIAHNVTADHRKSAARRAQHAALGEPGEIEDRDDALGAFERTADMMRAIAALTEEQQQVIVLRFYQGMSTAQVAVVVGKPESAVKALQARGLRSLRRMLTADGLEEERATA